MKEITPSDRAAALVSRLDRKGGMVSADALALEQSVTQVIQAAQTERLRTSGERLVSAAVRTEPDYEQCLARMTPEMMRLLHVAMGLQTESAEFTDMLKKHIFYGKALDHVNLIEELGDCTWYERVGCAALEIAYLDMIERNVMKLRARFPDRYSDEAAVNRDLQAERAILEGR